MLIAVPLNILTTGTASLTLVFDATPERVKQAFGIVAIVATVNGVLIQMIMASRVLYGLGQRGHLLAFLAIVSSRTCTPIVATLLVALIIGILAITMPIDALAERTSQIFLFVFVLVNLSLIRLKMADQADGYYFQVPIGIPVMGVITSIALFATILL